MTTGTAGQTALVYPETDGMPLPDGEFQAPLYREIVSTLQTHFKALTNARVNGDTFIYYQEGDPRRRVAPDCYVSFDVSPQTIERHNNYRLWEVGKAAGLRPRDRLAKHGGDRPGREARSLRQAGHSGVLALRLNGRGLLWRAAGRRVPAGG